jgi:hypothetical protein
MFMESVLEVRPNVGERTGPKIAQEFLPIKDYKTYRIMWEKVRDYAPIAGAYALEDLPDTLDELDFQTFQSDVLHWGTRMTLSAKQLMFLRYAGQSNIVNASDPYGQGPAADEQRSRDAEKIAKYTRYMNTALDNVIEYIGMWALQGLILWPPLNENGVALAAADVPLSMGKLKINHEIPFLLASGGDGSFHQAASALLGLSGGVSATGAAWNTSSANMIVDMSVILDLIRTKMRMEPSTLLMLMDSRVMHHLSSQTAHLDWILGTNRDRDFLTVTDLRDFIKSKFEWTIRFYNSAWEYVLQRDWDTTNPTIHTVQFMPAGTVMIIPQPQVQRMGNIATAPAPGPAHQWLGGKYMWTDRDIKPPWKTEMGMGGYWWPLVRDNDVRFRLNAWS